MFTSDLIEKSKALVQVVAALSIIGGGLMFMSEHPFIQSRVATMAGTEELAKRIDESNESLNTLIDKVNNLETGENYSSAPVLEFTIDGNEVSDGDIGDLIVFDISYIQFRNCGRPSIVAAFRNGNNIVHVFQDISIISQDGRSLSSPPSEGQILRRRFTARIPANSGVKQGDAVAWLEFGPFPACQNAPTVYSPRMPFRIRHVEIDLRPRPGPQERG